MEQAKIFRLLNIIKLMTCNNYYDLEGLANHLEISTRTVRRYIETLKEAGFIFDESSNKVRLSKDSPFFKQITQLVHFTEEEAWVIKAAIEGVDDTHRMKQQVKQKLQELFLIDYLGEVVTHPQHVCNIEKLSEAIRNGKKVILKSYHSANSHTVQDRLVEPFHFSTNNVSIWAYEIASGQNKQYKLSRIESVEILSEEWEFASAHEREEMDIFRNSGKQSIPVIAHLKLRAAELLKEEYPLAERDMKQDGPNKWILTTTLTNYEGFCRFYLGLSEEIEIIEPESLKYFIENRIKLIKI